MIKSMATTSIDTGELGYLKSCRDKLCRIVEILDEKGEKEDEKEKDREFFKEQLQKIKKIIKNFE